MAPASTRTSSLHRWKQSQPLPTASSADEAQNARLHCLEAGPSDGVPLVLLHGFGGHAQSWSQVIPYLPLDARTLAFDLPGHAGSLRFPGFGSPRTAALSVLAELRARGIGKAHVAGHSMGGAAAVLMALDDPAAIASLTLIAPGGFGPQMAGSALRAFAEAETEEALANTYAAMMATPARPDLSMIASLFAVHSLPDQKEALRQTLARISRGDGQGELPLGALAKGQFPVSLLWGDRDIIVPYAQSANAPAWFARISIPAKGHMLLDEAPAEVAAAIASQLGKQARTI